MIRLVILLAALPVVAANAQTPSARLAGETEAAQTRKRLVEAQAALGQGRTADAVDELLRILTDSGDDLVPLPDGSHQPARRLVQRVLVSLPAESLKNVRDRIDAPAKQLLDAGRARRDPKPLRELLERYFVSQHTEPALVLLGELAFERGEFATAERYWRTLLPAAREGFVSVPQPITDPAGAWAKVILAVAFANERDRAAAELVDFQKAHPTATGRLAGRSARYTDTLTKLLANPPRIANAGEGWSTLGGNPQRDGRAGAMPRHFPNRPKWKAAIPRDLADPEKPKPAGVSAPRGLAYHPVIHHGTAYIADAGRVYSFHLQTGAARIAYDVRALDPQFPLDSSDLVKPLAVNADFALTVAGGHLYARLGNFIQPGAPKIDDAPKREPASVLVQLEPTNGPVGPANALTLEPTWTVTPPVKPGVPATWEGTPLVVDGIAVAAFTRIENSRRIHAVAAYRLPNTTPLWVAEAGDVDANQVDSFPHRHELLTLAGPNAVYATHVGLTVAFDIVTGRRAWAFRSPPAARPPVGGSPRKLCPAVASGGRVFIAPADGEQVFALDADTGAKLWDSGPAPVQIDYFLGVARGRLIAAIHGPNKGLRAYAVTDGRDREPGGWTDHRDIASYGRGLLTDDVIVWPNATTTSGKMDFLDPRDGQPVGAVPLSGPHGNLAYADGVLIVATATEVWGYLGETGSEPSPKLARPSTWVKGNPSPFRPIEMRKPPRAEFDALTAPALAPSAKVKELSLPVVAWPLHAADIPAELTGLSHRVDPTERRFFACDGQSLFAVRLTDGEILWRTRLDPPAAFTRGLLLTDGRLVAFADSALGGFDAKTGQAKWRRETAGLSIRAETTAGNRVVVLLGEHTLAAIDPDTGQVAWLLDSQLRPRWTAAAPEPAPSFVPQLHGTARAVYAHRSDGTRLEIQPETGQAVATANEAISNWASSPIADGNRTIFPNGPLRVTARRTATGPSEWVCDFPGSTSSTGRTPRLRIGEEALWVAVERTYGHELHRLKLSTGVPLWTRPVVRTDGDFDLSAADFDRERIYVPQGRCVVALNAADGREAWSRELPGEGWQVKVGRSGVVVFPREARFDEERAVLLARLWNRFRENPFRLPGLFATWVANEWNRTVPVILLDADTGAIRQGWEVPAAGPVLGVYFAGDVAVVASTGVVAVLAK